MPDAKLEDGTILRFPEGTSQDVITKAVKKHMGLAEQIPLDKSMDKKSGAPMKVRALVGNTKKPEDAISTLQKYYPDAQPYGEDNYVFTDPDTGRPTLYNPEGFESGDLAEWGRAAAQFAGGVVGGGVGLAGSTPTGLTAAPVMVPSGAALGSQFAGQLYDQGARWLGQDDTRSVPEAITEGAVETGTEAIFQKAAPMVTGAIGKGIRGVGNKIKGVVDQRLLSGMARESVPVEGAAGMISDSRVVGGLTHALRVIPSSANTMATAAEKTMQGIDKLFRGTASKFGTAASKEEGGRAIQKGSMKFVDTFKDKASKMYDNLSLFVKPDEVVQLPNTSNFLSGKIKEFPDQENIAAIVSPKKFEGILKDILGGDMADLSATGQLTWKQLKTLRTAVGELADDPSVFSDISKKQWKALYSSLSSDMEALAASKGDKALQAFNRANQFYRGGVNRIDDFMDNVINSPTAEAAFNKAFSGAKDGGTALRALRKSIPKENWDDFLAAKMHEMGAATPGKQAPDGMTFSPSTFLTNWSRLSKDAKAALFGGTKYKDAGRSLDTLLEVSKRAKDLEALANHSGTGSMNFYVNLLTTGGMGAGGYAVDGTRGAATAVALPYMSAKLLTNPKFVRWLSRGIQEGATDFNSVTAHMGRLLAIAKVSPSIREEIYQFAKSVRDISQVSEEEGAAKTGTAAPGQ